MQSELDITRAGPELSSIHAVVSCREICCGLCRSKFLKNASARWFVEQLVLAARMVASRSVGRPTDTVAEIHDDLRRQHPEWTEPGGESPMCAAYDARLGLLVDTWARARPA